MWPDRLYVTGTDTDVGKTVSSALICRAFGYDYVKPVQAGRPTDAETVARWAPSVRVHPTPLFVEQPASPHAGAEAEGRALDRPELPITSRLLAEGAGGWMVPYRAAPLTWQGDWVRAWGLPALVIARSGLGTLNHTFLTLRALRADGIPIVGIVLVGDPHPHNARDLGRWGAPVLARIPLLRGPEDAPRGVAALRAGVDGLASS